MKGYAGSKTDAAHRDTWQTPDWLFGYLNNIFNFKADVCASDKNAKCEKYFTEDDNCLTADWSKLVNEFDMVWCNPPYSHPADFIKKAAKECVINKIGTVMLLPADTSVLWFRDALTTADEVVFLTGKRISFIRSDTGKKGNGNNKGSMLIIWRPTHTQCRMSWLDIRMVEEELLG